MNIVAAIGCAKPIVEHAREYLKSGLSVIPIRADGSKAPTINWRTQQSRLATQEEVRDWFLADNVGIAIVHGKVSGNTECLDIDDDELLDDFADELRKICPGLLAKLTIIATPRPGYHLLYRCDEIGGSQKLAQSANGTKTLIETKGEGGYQCSPV